MKSITHLSLFSGIGGLDLAAEWAGMTTVGQCEWADYPTKVLEKHWPDVPRWKDIRTLTGESFYERTSLRTVDVISGGFPCQPFSVAGKQRGKEDDRYLWPEMVRVIKELRPTWVVGENVAGIVRMALPDILSELEACGYRTRTFLIPACAVGARHRRYRVAIVAYTNGSRLQTPGAKQQTTGTAGAGAAAGTDNLENPDSFRRGQPGNVCKQPGRTESERPGETLAYAESQPEGRLPSGEEQAVTGFGGSSKDVADSKSKGKRGLPVQQGRPQQEDTDTERSRKDVQYPDCTGCKEQHAAGQSDKQSLSGRGCDEGNVFNAPGTGLPDRASQPMKGQRTPQQEPKRPDSNVSDTDNGSRIMRRDGQPSAVEEAGDKRDNFRKGTEEHEPGQRRTAQSELGGMVNGFSCWLDGNIESWIEEYWDMEPDIPRIATGIPHRVDKLKALGNAVVPPQFYPVCKAIVEIEKRLQWQERRPKP